MEKKPEPEGKQDPIPGGGETGSCTAYNMSKYLEFVYLNCILINGVNRFYFLEWKHQ